MNLINISYFLLVSIFIVVTNGDILTDIATITNSPIVLYPNELKKCKMYDDACYFTLQVEKGISAEILKAEVEDESRASVLKLVSCENLNQVALSSDYSTECSKINKSEEHDLYVIHLSPQLIGYTSLTVSSKMEDKDVFAKQYLVIQEPQRFVDRIFFVWVWSVNIVVACVMGLLLDLETIKKFFIMPIPAAIGFMCQYLLMPLVLVLFDTVFIYLQPHRFGVFLLL